VTAVAAQQDVERLWIRQTLTGDQTAFADLVQAYQRPVYNLCYRMLGDVAEAEDAAQETFLRGYTNLHRYDPDRRFLNWILSIASNHCIDRLRRRRIHWLSLEDTPLVEHVAGNGEPAQRRVERHEQAAEVQAWLDQLPPPYRVPLILLYWHDLSYEEIADVLQLSVPAVKSRLHRARKQVAEIIAKDAKSAESPNPKGF